jgi:antibiotic biosynthesis monooxygenase (ABM) superfamily enzyme
MLMATQTVLGPALLSLPMPVRMLAMTAIVVPTVVYGLLPAILRAHAALRRRTAR